MIGLTKAVAVIMTMMNNKIQVTGIPDSPVQVARRNLVEMEFSRKSFRSSGTGPPTGHLKEILLRWIVPRITIYNRRKRVVGHYCYREIPNAEDIEINVLSPAPIEPYKSDHLSTIAAIRSKADRFPIVELSDIQIYERKDRRKGHGSRAMAEFLDLAFQQGYHLAIVKMGKHSPNDSLEDITQFYEDLGWIRFPTRHEFSLRFAYYSLK